jgi:ubiquinone/menaquinone biosynthesis C-methylase UbiE
MKLLISCLVSKRQTKDENVIDLGCGTGSYSIALAQEGFSVLGVDFSPKMVEKAKNKIYDESKKRTEFQLLDINQPLPFSSNSFDHAICIHVFQVLEDPVSFLEQLHKILKPDGHFLILIKDSERRHESKIKLKKSFTKVIIILFKKILRTTKPIRKYKKAELEQLLFSSGFEVVEDCPFPGAIGVLAKNIQS